MPTAKIINRDVINPDIPYSSMKLRTVEFIHDNEIQVAKWQGLFQQLENCRKNFGTELGDLLLECGRMKKLVSPDMYGAMSSGDNCLNYMFNQLFSGEK